VAALRAQGFDTYMLDWGIPDERDADNGLDTYVDELLPAAVQAVLETSGADEVNVIGYCYGGLLSLLLGAAHPELPVSSLITMATPVDFDEMGMFGRMFDKDRLAPDDLLDETGNVPPRSSATRSACSSPPPTSRSTPCCGRSSGTTSRWRATRSWGSGPVTTSRSRDGRSARRWSSCARTR
jgi:pimeloyl-ACP methyl ester carboxylesterase